MPGALVRRRRRLSIVRERIVPTLDSVRYMSVLERLVLHNFHVLCIGPTGTGKTLSVLNKLMNGMPDSKRAGVATPPHRGHQRPLPL